MPLLAGTIIHSEAGSYRLGKWSPGVGNAINAIYWAWCGHRYVRCAEGDQALTVATCETGGSLSVWARNSNPPDGDRGDFLGLLQMGDYARERYGHSWNPWGQARAGHRYWQDSGWSPWQCHENGGLRW